MMDEAAAQVGRGRGQQSRWLAGAMLSGTGAGAGLQQLFMASAAAEPLITEHNKLTVAAHTRAVV